MHRLLDAIDSKRDYAIFLLAYRHGLRAKEFLVVQPWPAVLRVFLPLKLARPLSLSVRSCGIFLLSPLRNPPHCDLGISGIATGCRNPLE
jgi:hypothetical protein